jgi:hypothetical protein
MIEQFIFGMHWKHDGKMYYAKMCKTQHWTLAIFKGLVGSGFPS